MIIDGWEVEVKITNVAGSELPEIEFRVIEFRGTYIHHVQSARELATTS
jgi:hypothetical protein